MEDPLRSRKFRTDKWEKDRNVKERERKGEDCGEGTLAMW